MNHTTLKPHPGINVANKKKFQNNSTFSVSKIYVPYCFSHVILRGPWLNTLLYWYSQSTRYEFNSFQNILKVFNSYFFFLETWASHPGFCKLDFPLWQRDFEFRSTVLKSDREAAERLMDMIKPVSFNKATKFSQEKILTLWTKRPWVLEFQWRWKSDWPKCLANYLWNNLCSEKLCSNNLCSDNLCSNNLSSDNLCSDNLCSDKLKKGEDGNW